MCLASTLALLLAIGASPGFDEITQAIGSNGRAQSRVLMDAWVRDHPNDPNAGRGLIWIAQLYVADGQADRGRPYYERAARDYPATEWGKHGIRGMAELDLAHWHFSRALEEYASLAVEPEPLWNYIGRMGVENTRQTRIRFFAFLAALAGLVGTAGWRLVAARRAGERLGRLPEECLYLLPALGVIALAAVRQPYDEARAVVTVAVGGALLLWANGLYLRARPPRGLRRIAETALGLVQGGALLYCAVIACDIWLKFHDTLVMGAE